MKNKKGFTLIELLAVIVVLAIILVIAGSSVINSINDSKEKAKYMAAKEIVSMAEAYFAVNTDKTYVSVETLVEEGYLEEDVTNPATGENRSASNKLSGHQVYKGDFSEQSGYAPSSNKYSFDGYQYKFN